MSDFRPRSAAEIADAAIQLVRRHYAAMLPLAALLSIPNVLLGLVTARAQPIGIEAPTFEAVAAVGAAALVSTVWWSLQSGALVAVAAAAYVGEPIDPWAAARRAFRRAGRLVGVNLATWLIILGAFMAVGIVAAVGAGLVAAVVGGPAGGRSGVLAGAVALVAVLVALVWPMLLFARYVTVTPIVMVEDVGPGAAIRRAGDLSKGLLARSLGLLVIALVLLVATVLTAMGLASLVVSNEQVASIFAQLAMVPLYPAWACLLAVLYYDLRIRKEGYDIELMARSVGGAAPQPDPAVA